MMHLFDSITFETTTTTTITPTPTTTATTNTTATIPTSSTSKTNKLTSSSSSSSAATSLNGSMTANLVDLGKKLLDASRNGQTEHVRSLTQSGAPFTNDYLGTSPLHFAAQNGHTDSAEILLRAGVSKDARTKLDRTALHVAAQEGHLSMVELLLSHGADANARDMLKMTPLHWAVERGHISIVDRLLNSGADASATSKFFITPVEIAEELEYYEILGLLRRFMSNVDATNFDRVTSARSNHISSSESRSCPESTSAPARRRNRGSTKGNANFTAKNPTSNIVSAKAIVSNSGNTSTTNFYSQMIRPLIESNSDILNMGSGLRFDGNKRRVLIANISSANSANKATISDMSGPVVDKQTAEWLKSALTSSAPDLNVTQRFCASRSGDTNSDEIDSGNFNASDDFNPLDMIGDGVDDIDFDDDDEHPILNAYHNFDYSENCLNSQSDIVAHDRQLANSDTSIFNESKLGSENSLDQCLDLVDLEKHSIKIDPDLFLPTTTQCQKDVDVRNEDVSQKLERLKKLVEELQRENSQLRQRVEELTAASGPTLYNHKFD